MTPVHSPPSAGLAGARNAGMRAATGAYLLFLDGDDTFVPGALAALDARLADTGGVDVLYFEHERVPWWEGETTNPAAPLLAKTPDGAFAPDRAPHLTGVDLPAWSAVHRRTFLTERRLDFGGHFTDVGFGARVAARAERMAVLREVVVRHRVRRQGNRLNLPGEHHADLLDQAELALTHAVERGLPPERRGPLFEQLFAAVLKTATHPRRLTRRGRRAFYRRASRLYRRHRPAGFRPPGGRLGVQHRLLASGSYTAFRALRAANRTATGVLRRLPWPRGLRTRLRYRRHLRRPLDPNLVVYCAYWGRGYACNPAAIHAKARELAPHLRSVFLVEPDQAHTLPEGVDHAVVGSHRYWEVLARATYLVNNANFAEGVVKRPGSVHLQTQHGTPLKTMGVDQSTYPVVAAATGSFTKLLARVDRWDFNLSANRHSTQMWERAFPARTSTWSTATRATTSTARRPPGTWPGCGANWASRRGRRRSCTRPRTGTGRPGSARAAWTWRRSARRPAKTSWCCCAPITSTTGAGAGNAPAGSST